MKVFSGRKWLVSMSEYATWEDIMFYMDNWVYQFDGKTAEELKKTDGRRRLPDRLMVDENDWIKL